MTALRFPLLAAVGIALTVMVWPVEKEASARFLFNSDGLPKIKAKCLYNLFAEKGSVVEKCAMKIEDVGEIKESGIDYDIVGMPDYDEFYGDCADDEKEEYGFYKYWYERIGRTPDESEVYQVVLSACGSGYLTALRWIRRTEEQIVPARELAFGDRCSGGLDHSKLLENGTIRTWSDTTPYMVVEHMADASRRLGISALAQDFPDGATSCMGFDVVDVNALTGEKRFVGVELTKPIEFVSNAQYTDCVKRLFSEFAPKLPAFLDVSALAALDARMRRECFAE